MPCKPLEWDLCNDSVAIVVGDEDQTFSVSAHLLMEHSPVFRNILTTPMVESAHRLITLPDVTSPDLRAFLEALEPVLPVPPNR